MLGVKQLFEAVFIVQRVDFLNYRLRFPGKGQSKSSNDDKHGHGREKRRPSTYVDGFSCTSILIILLAYLICTNELQENRQVIVSAFHYYRSYQQREF